MNYLKGLDILLLKRRLNKKEKMRYFLVIIFILFACSSRSQEYFLFHDIGFHLNDSSGRASVCKKEFEYYDKVTIPPYVEKGNKVYVVDEIETDAFSACENLLRVILPTTIKRIGECAFSSSSVQSVNMPDSLIEVAKRAFEDCRCLKELIFNSPHLKVGKSAFEGCISLNKVYFHCDSVEFEQCAFKNSGIKEITLPASINIIKQGMFSLCGALQEFTVPKNVETIECNAFAGCTFMKKVLLPNGVKSIENGAFASVALEKFYLPSSVESIDGAPVSGKNLKHIFCYADGLIFKNEDYKKVVLHVPKRLYKKYKKSVHGIFKEIVVAKPKEMPAS